MNYYKLQKYIHKCEKLKQLSQNGGSDITLTSSQKTSFIKNDNSIDALFGIVDELRKYNYLSGDDIPIVNIGNMKIKELSKRVLGEGSYGTIYITHQDRIIKEDKDSTEVKLGDEIDNYEEIPTEFRRYVAKKSLEKLIEDGRIQPARIEEIVENTTKEADVLLREL